MPPRELLEQNLDLVARTVARACHRAGILGADASEIQSMVHIALIENDYAILRAWEGRSSLATYLAVIVRRLIADEQIRASGRWHASAEAKRLGESAVMIETLLVRRRRSIDDALPIVRAADPTMTRERIEQIAAQLPARTPRPRAVELDELILALNRNLGLTVVMVTHELESIFKVGKHCIMLDRESRSVIARGEPQRLRTESDDPRVRRFFNRETSVPQWQ